MNKTRIDGIDYLRAACSVFVVVWHMKAAGHSLIFSRERLAEHTFNLSDFLNFHILLLAVPTFIFVSAFLYAYRGPGYPALIERTKRLLILAVFWPVALTVSSHGLSGIIKIIPTSINHFAFFVLRAGYTPYYFFVSLMICLFVTDLAYRMSRTSQILGFVFSSALLTILPQITRHTGIFLLSVYWCPLNFIPFSFAAVLAARNLHHINTHRFKLAAASILACALFAVFEWKYSVDAMFFDIEGAIAIPAYTRTSLVFGVLALSIPALNMGVKSYGIVKYMSKYSLSLFCIHIFIMSPAKKVVAGIIKDSVLCSLVSIITVILGCYLIAFISKNFLKEKVLF
jgi:hypothetical protein